MWAGSGCPDAIMAAAHNPRCIPSGYRHQITWIDHVAVSVVVDLVYYPRTRLALEQQRSPSGLFGWLRDVLSDFNRSGAGFLEVCFPEVCHLLLLGDPQRTAIFGPPSTDAGGLYVCVLKRCNQFIFSQLTDKPIDRGRKKFPARKVIRILDQIRVNVQRQWAPFDPIFLGGQDHGPYDIRVTRFFKLCEPLSQGLDDVRVNAFTIRPDRPVVA